MFFVGCHTTEKLEDMVYAYLGLLVMLSSIARIVLVIDGHALETSLQSARSHGGVGTGSYYFYLNSALLVDYNVRSCVCG